MKTLHNLLFKQFIKVFFVSMLMFVAILIFVDLFMHLYQYIQSDASIKDIAKITFFYIPKCIHFSMTLSVLFAVAYTLGNLYANNELISVFASGIPLYKFVTPLLLFGIFGSIFNFLFEEFVVIDSLKKKNKTVEDVLYYSFEDDYSKRQAAVYDVEKNIIYYANYYNDKRKTLSKFTIVRLSKSGKFLQRIDGELGTWDGVKWVLNEVRIFTLNKDTGEIEEEFKQEYVSPLFTKNPRFFRDIIKNIEELKLLEAISWLKELKDSRIPKKYRDATIDLNKRFSFTFTTFIVALISSSLGSKFNKNILLYSLLLSVAIAVTYYVFQMLTVLFAKNRLLSPFLGAWLPFFCYLILGRYLFRKSKT